MINTEFDWLTGIGDGEMMNRYRIWWLGLVVGLVFTVSARAELLGRLPATPGGTDYQAAYDDVLDITWVTDAGLSGPGTWDEQVAWAEGLELLGANDWRLASISVSAGVPTGDAPADGPVGCSSTGEQDCRDNELGYMYYQNLGGSFPNDLTGNQTVDGVTLTDIQSQYWSGTQNGPDAAFNLFFENGDQGIGLKSFSFNGWAVRDGDIGLLSGPVDLNGTVEDADGTGLCALVLASGDFMFSCNPNGPFSLTDLPREDDGTVKRQVYVDGFFPEVDVLQGSMDETVVMTRASSCPDYNSFPDPSENPGSAGKRIDISGTVFLQDTQTPVCAIVLANGQFGFTCDDTGSYSGNIPLDNNGQFKLQVYADGFAPMVQRFDESRPNNDVRMARAAECQ